MTLLLDTHVFLAEAKKSLGLPYQRYPVIFDVLAEDVHVSVVSLWEIAIKVRLGKLERVVPMADLSGLLATLRMSILPVNADHAVADVSPEPDTRDPFDRMLLAQCAVEGLRLVTVDHALVGHPLAWRPPA